MATMTAKQTKFIDEYMIDLNQTKAAIRAGYSPKTANEQASRLLTNVNIQHELQKKQAEQSRRTGITQDRVLNELAKIGFSNMDDFVMWGRKGINLRESNELSREDAACVQEVSESITEYGSTTKIKLYDKKSALELIGKHIGLFNDKIQHSGDIGIKIEVDYGDDGDAGNKG